jgi:hypothetical protein
MTTKNRVDHCKFHEIGKKKKAFALFAIRTPDISLETLFARVLIFLISVGTYTETTPR